MFWRNDARRLEKIILKAIAEKQMRVKKTVAADLIRTAQSKGISVQQLLRQIDAGVPPAQVLEDVFRPPL